jgi:RNA polymerase subunit RPABC4/transcription elongation factor Spt4/Arc/MetJ-type ribon-helix-helix transcriptional regulator
VSKITFRADDALVEQLDSLDASKSEVMREALREFLDRHPDVGGEREVATNVTGKGAGSTAEEQSTGGDGSSATVPGLTVNINLDGTGEASVEGPAELVDEEEGEEACKQCGAAVSAEHSFCPNCGEERRGRSRCECGEEIRSDWTFCPGCGRRSSTADVFDHA